jgi:hypothetical protein
VIEHLDHLAIGLEQLHVLERALALDPASAVGLQFVPRASLPQVRRVCARG